MREFKRTVLVSPRGKLRRAADGSLRPAGEQPDIADIWAERDRVRLQESIAAQQKKVAKKQRSAKEIEIKLTLPKVNWAHRRRQLAKLWAMTTRKQRWVACIVIAAVLGLWAWPHFFAGGKSDRYVGAANPTGVHAANPIGGVQPQFPTILPAGKTIQQLGGWGRVSPPDKNPVFAYSDVFGGIHIVVSEQPLPDGFSGSLQAKVAQLANQFAPGAHQVLIKDAESVGYAGPETNGAQSFIAAKVNLLVLIRASGQLSDQSWSDYLATLQ
ncbi:MAG TPA: hypothetical protein VKQ34_00350 [Candidatus Saccharimonadales bacterium]|nr:hypothetical protein [Candidatus Saccharimonadales bacterium]